MGDNVRCFLAVGLAFVVTAGERDRVKRTRLLTLGLAPVESPEELGRELGEGKETFMFPLGSPF
jgi:hypothetical protein